ncbi:abortive infection protein [Actinoplanes sp. SE50]|uniref:CPBP family intramembrane glutamic endopeptidase n=1 Tax=unclassified Actinoplanes TaxID=2626549 RepID=UPI00023ECB99|nr:MULTISPECIES: CPBP family intramembrane glutamic endopeptidase [unclassified Actinoplanes]AEV86550.1 abortive infection protein [Actinoplanes sp. SE50/110]ATO84948.1 abortive infection protein [Actinoplanes sp. SE50]SLM02357.1 abortive infection protein [Actinoplanes sp. SE50/110]
MTVVAVVGIIGLVRLWTRFGPGWAQPVTGPLAAALLITVSGRTARQAGLTVSGWRYAAAAVVLIGVGYAVAVRLPAARRLFRTTYDRPWLTALIEVPLATVVFEEVAFRGVLWSLLDRDHGAVAATAVTAVLFGLWHLAPERPWTDAVVTGVAGVLLGVLRAVGGGLLAPALVHWAVDGIGVLAAAHVTRTGVQWGRPQAGAG